MNYEDAKLLESYWHLVVSELDAQIVLEENSLRICKPEELVRIQTRIKVYEELKSLPQRVVERRGIQA